MADEKTEAPAAPAEAAPAAPEAPKLSLWTDDDASAQTQPDAPVHAEEAAPTEAAPAPDTKPQDAPETKDEPLSKRLTALAKQEAKLREERQRFKREQEDSKRLADEKALKWEKFQKLLAEDPDAALALASTSYEQLTMAKVQGKPARTPEAPEVLELRKQVEQMQLREQQRAQQAEWAKFQGDIKSAITAKEDFELCREYGDEAQELVTDVIVQHHRSTGEVMDVAEAAERVEKYYQQRAEAALKTKKFSSKLSPTATALEREVRPPAKPGRPPEQRQPTASLSNAQAAAVAPKAPPPDLDSLDSEGLRKVALSKYKLWDD